MPKITRKEITEERAGELYRLFTEVYDRDGLLTALGLAADAISISQISLESESMIAFYTVAHYLMRELVTKLEEIEPKPKQ